MDGARELHEKVAQAAHEWLIYANLLFVFDERPDAEIRVTFDTVGLWSYVGTDALEVPLDQPTVGLGALDMRILHRAVLHVFGHVLGFVHEHQNPSGDIPFKGLKPDLLSELTRLSVTDTSLGRTSLLDGIPGADTLNRDAPHGRS